MRYGLDFGTSNSAIGLASTMKVSLVPLTVSLSDPFPMPSLLFLDRSAHALVGHAAASAYVDLNVGRTLVPTRLIRPQIIETVFGDEYVQFDVDGSLPGRFFQALKRSLSDASFEGTDVFGSYYPIEDLVGLILRAIKGRADNHFGRECTAVLLGRPVRFAEDPAADALALSRLRRAAELAGFTDVAFLYEPLGAAWHYRQSHRRAGLAFVFDFGGGTLDLSVIRWRGSHDAGEILGVAGVLIGGNTLNEDIMERRLFRYFGEGVSWHSRPGKRLPLPRHIFDRLRTWYTIHQLNQRQLLAFLEEVQRAASDPEQVAALISLVIRNYGWDLFMAIESAKCALSTAEEVVLDFQRPAIDIYERITRREFEQFIAPRLAEIDRGIQHTLAEAGLDAAAIDVVLCTGGSSLSPCVQRLLARRFGEEKILRQDAFTSVVSGLAAAASEM
jgi:hypothetical chaperone protein